MSIQPLETVLTGEKKSKSITTVTTIVLIQKVLHMLILLQSVSEGVVNKLLGR